MKNFYLLILFLFLSSLAAPPLLGQVRTGGPRADESGQSLKSSITGTVFDSESDSPLDYATVSLYNAAQELVTGTITEGDGRFMIEARPGSYSIQVDFLGYDPYRIDDIQLERNQQLDLGQIDVNSSAAQLDEVTVTATRSTMQLALDKRIFNVGSDLASRGGSATELLDNVPSVQVDVEGNVSLRGSSNVRILINGRPSNLLGSDGAGLQQLPANLIERVEVVTNPSARYEAEGTGGIINIILREDRAKGLNGSFDVTVGRPDNFGTSINLNRRANKLNFFTNLGVTYRNRPGDGSLYNETYNEDVTLISVQSNERIRSGIGGNFRFGADYFFNERNTLTTALSYRYGDDANENVTTYSDYENSLDNPTGSEIRLDEEFEDDRRLEYSLNYKLTFPNNEGQQLTADIRYQDNTETEGSDLSNSFFDPFGNPADRADLIQRSNNTESEDQLIFQSDYVHPFGEDHQLEAGVRASIRNIDNDFLVEELDNDTDAFFPLEGLSNTFAYDERVYAAYLTYGNKFGRFSFQVGIRPEYSEINTRLLQTDEVNERDFLNFFPSAFINYELPGQNSIQISYSRRISRPRFWTLNPFFTFTDNRNFFAGNPNLNPEFTNSFELGHLKYFDKGSISSALYYRKTFDVVQRLRTVDELGNSVTLPQNLATRDAYGLEVALNYDIASWWRFSTDLNFFGFQTEGQAFEQDFRAEGFSWFTRGTSRFKINPKFDAQIRYNYRAPQNNAQGRRRSISSVDLAASHDLWKDRATLTFGVRDLFNSRRRRFTLEGDNFFSEGDSRWRVRQVDLTLSYRLNQDKQRQRGERGGGYDGGDGEY
ncbi:MAG: outer membrane beta-barrel family protein [Bacteroidota bacterium]